MSYVGGMYLDPIDCVEWTHNTFKDKVINWGCWKSSHRRVLHSVYGNIISEKNNIAYDFTTAFTGDGKTLIMSLMRMEAQHLYLITKQTHQTKFELIEMYTKDTL